MDERRLRLNASVLQRKAEPFPRTSKPRRKRGVSAFAPPPLIYADLCMCDFFRKVCTDQSLRPFREREFVRQAAFEEHTDAGMPQRIGRSDQGHVARYLQVRQMAGLGEDEKFAGNKIGRAHV